ncbi:hypothetical protein UlMin_024568 [Ulmus minor]
MVADSDPSDSKTQTWSAICDLLFLSPSFYLSISLNKIPVIKILGATKYRYDIIDLSDNEIVKLEIFCFLNRLGTLLINNNRIIGKILILEFLPKLHILVLTNSRLPLGEFLLQSSYRLYVIHKLRSLQILDFKKVKNKGSVISECYPEQIITIKMMFQVFLVFTPTKINQNTVNQMQMIQLMIFGVLPPPLVSSQQFFE